MSSTNTSGPVTKEAAQAFFQVYQDSMRSERALAKDVIEELEKTLLTDAEPDPAASEASPNEVKKETSKSRPSGARRNGAVHTDAPDAPAPVTP